MNVDTDKLLAISSIVVAFIALAVGLFHVVEIRRVLTRAKTQIGKLENLEKTSSTRYLDEFPKFLPRINELINNANDKLVIFCNIPAYGNFSDPLSWKLYCRAIEDTKEKERFTLELVCLAPDHRLTSYNEVLHEWDTWKNDRLEQLKNFLWERKKFWFVGKRPSPTELQETLESLTRDDFKGLLEETNNEMIEGPFANIEPRFIRGTRMPVFFWLADGRNAIFSIPARRKKHTELGFITSDSNLIDALLAIRARYLGELTEGPS
jgi:hypothetical protein